MALASGMRLDHYEVLSLLGVGGMGEVYLAQDLKLARKVALKLLPAKFTADADRIRRFEQEARAVSALNHPNLVTIFEIGQAQGQHFMAYEYIDGQSLRERLSQERLSAASALDIALQTVTALNAAHEAGIIHRDIKPDNIMLRRDGIVKVLDFGLAKLAEETKPVVDSEAATLAKISTDPGTVMGTPQYMSPEQARGQKADARTDIFSLGVVLYEMLSGRAAFDGVNPLDVISAILRAEPAPLKEALAEVPPELAHQLEHIVSKALRKDRDERYQTSKDLLIDLRDFKEELAFAARLNRSGQPGRTAPIEAHDTNEQAFRVPPSGGGLAAQAPPPEGGTLNTRARKFALPFIALAAIIIALAAFFYFKRQPVLTDKDTILLTDFTNTTGDAVFDGTLKQALAVHLGQSPFLNIFSDERVRETLRFMGRSPDERVTPTIGREICQRQGLKAMLTGSIASLGRNYVINLEAVNGQSGEVLAREQDEAESKEQVLRSLGEAATELREKLGESLSLIQRFDAPIEQATTSSLEALKAWSLGIENNSKGKVFEAIPFLKHAIELDPSFAAAHIILAQIYWNSRQPGIAVEAAQKAFELREHVSEREKLWIAMKYYMIATGEVNKAIEVLELLKQTYPRDFMARHNLGSQYQSIGQYEKAIEEYREAIHLNPNDGGSYGNLADTFIRLNRFEEAKAMNEQVKAQKIDDAALHRTFYIIAFIQGDTAAMKQQVDWASARPGEYAHLNWQAGAAAFAGKWQKAREFSNRAAELAEQRNLQEAAGEILSSNAVQSAVLGQCQQSRAALARAVALPRTATSLFRAGLALALCGEVAQAQALSDEAVNQHPKNTIVNEIFLPLIRAALELQRGNRTQAIQILQAASRYESASLFYQNYLRGQAYLGERKGAEAASEFQKILDHRGWAPASPLYPLAHLGLARAAALTGDAAKSRQSYQDFFALWKDADADLPVLLEAKKEYEKLK